MSSVLGNNISRQLSADSVSSLVSMSSACSISSGNQHVDMNAVDKNKKKRGWVGVVVVVDIDNCILVIMCRSLK